MGEEAEGSTGGKLWKLMKRISTGGLRDKYQSRDSAPPPPVPALPKDLPSRLTLDIQNSPSDELVGEEERANDDGDDEQGGNGRKEKGAVTNPCPNSPSPGHVSSEPIAGSFGDAGNPSSTLERRTQYRCFHCSESVPLSMFLACNATCILTGHWKRQMLGSYVNRFLP